MTRKQKLLAKIRSWIDRRLPRDVLRVTVFGIPEKEGDTVTLLLDTTHMDQLLACKMDEKDRVYHYNGRVVITFHAEHLSV